MDSTNTNSDNDSTNSRDIMLKPMKKNEGERELGQDDKDMGIDNLEDEEVSEMSDDSEEVCAICIQQLYGTEEDIEELDCGHDLHLSCWCQYVDYDVTKTQKKVVLCPICKEELFPIQRNNLMVALGLQDQPHQIITINGTTAETENGTDHVIRPRRVRSNAEYAAISFCKLFVGIAFTILILLIIFHNPFHSFLGNDNNNNYSPPPPYGYYNYNDTSATYSPYAMG